ncbi:MAG: hypothetical protein CVV64_11725 [Candidatus Wallbacteria bacterium HGW-Wallbacteria-1]|jgi:5-methylthioadenosine/S-adenosylhomocysteine deaminase|uniref:Amidohydrolase-related domain-containing protein n=1 Tax=Candidatus Wallbacteria bacterium HGW-Wallbacteria-1 TaxID=2013854 RepID=A0A2N1PNU2_9BACT|nr:MAG: hypothetical protein CVV64_11725 [Candidatus Wallbacteria bacterium HGW-Wallbacteria-1]
MKNVSLPRPATRYTVVRAEFLIPVSDHHGRQSRIHDGYVLTEGSTITEAGPFSEEIRARIISQCGSDLTVVGGRGSEGKEIPMLRAAILPGFVKAHGHDHESPIIGVAKDCPLTEWLDEAVNLFTGFMNEDRAILEEKFGKSPNLVTYLKARVDDIWYGITTNMVHHCNHNKYRVEEIVTANLMAGTKMIVAVGSQDRNYDDRILDIPHNVAVERLDNYLAQFGGSERTWIIPGPDQFFSNGPDILKALKKWSRDHGTLIHIHSSEEPNTTKWFRETYGMTPIQYADSIGFLDENTILAHQVNNTDEDLEIIRRTGAKVVHNPLANTILGSGMPPVPRMMEMGIPVAISTDGSGSADFQNIICAARLASEYQKAVLKDAHVLPAHQVLEMITAIPAEFLRLNTGQIAPGRDADLVVLDISKPNMTPSYLENIVENIIWAADGSEARWVMANGVMVKDDNVLTTLDLDQILSEVQELAELFIEYKKKARKISGTGAHKE